MALDLDKRQRAMLQEMGVRVWLPMSVTDDLPVTDPVVAPSPPAAMAEPAQATPPSPDLPAELREAAVPLPAADGMDWPALVQAAAACQACGLCAGRTHSTLSGTAPAQADWMLVGDAPDEEEDQLGQPFAGPSGVLLENMLKAVGARRGGAARQGAHASNVVKCRAPTGRLPQAADLQQCAAFLQREIALVQPKVIVAMGRFAVQLLLGETPAQAALPLGKQRGTVYRYQGIAVIVTYHPRVLLRSGADKAKAWADLCLALEVVDGEAGN